MQIFLICILIKQQKHVAINNYLITQFTKQSLNLNYLLLTLNVTVQLLNYPKQKSPFFFLNFKFSLIGGELVFWFTFNLAVDFRPKMALTLEILSDQMHTLPRNSTEHTLFLFFASFRKSKSALCHLLSLRSKRFCAVREQRITFFWLLPHFPRRQNTKNPVPRLFLSISLLPNPTETLATQATICFAKQRVRSELTNS